MCSNGLIPSRDVKTCEGLQLFNYKIENGIKFMNFLDINECEKNPNM